MSTEPGGPPVAAGPAGFPSTPDTHERRVEAVLFAALEPLSPSDILTYAGQGDLGAALDSLAAHYAPRGVNLVERGGRWLFQTAPDCATVLERARETPRRLGRAALETLAIIAYHEPVTRAEIEEIRGVQTARGTLDTLMEAAFVRPAGRRETPGRPMQYATTPGFLAHFGLETRRDLPGIAELKAAGLLEPLPELPGAPEAELAGDAREDGTEDAAEDDRGRVGDDGALAPERPND